MDESSVAHTDADTKPRHDKFHKRYFGKAAAVRDAIVGIVRHLLPEADEWIDRIDFDTLEPMPTETVDEAFRSRFNDVVWRVRFRGTGRSPEWLHVIVMMEFQATVDWFMALRIQSYAVRIYESMWVGKVPTSESRLPPILAVVMYSGRRPWRAARRLSDLVGPDSRPSGTRVVGTPTLTGDSYVLVDLRRIAGEALPADNLVSVLARAHRIEGVKEVAATVDEALRVMRGSQREELRDVFFPWFGQLTKRLGIDLKFLEDEKMREQLEAAGDVRLVMEERLQAQLDGMKARSREEGREEGLKRARDLLRRMTARKFDADTAERLGSLLAGTRDPELLSSVVDWIMDCTTGSQLLARLRSAN